MMLIVSAAALVGCSTVNQSDESDGASAGGITSQPDTEFDNADQPSSGGGLMSAADLADAVGGAVWRVDVDDCDLPSGGSAFAISQTILLTNWHVVEFDLRPTVISRDGEALEGRVIGYRVDPDIAVIEVVKGELAHWVEFVAPNELREGDPIVSIGYPVPYTTFTVSPGWVMSFVEEDGKRIGIVSDESSDYGSSGGPLFDLRGRVVGVVTEFTPSDGLQPNGVSYTTAALGDAIDEILNDPQDLDTDCSGSTYGTDADLDALWDTCAEGRYWACDVLYQLSSAGTDYESFGARCGEADVDTQEYCVDLFGTAVPNDFGDDNLLDEAWVACEKGDAEGCDRLYFLAPLDTRYEEFGATCGDRLIGTEELCVDAM